MSTERMKWLPLESNPEVMSEYVKKLGLDSEDYDFCDIIGFDEELLQMVPQPVLAVLFLFPVTSQNEEKRKEADNQTHSIPTDVFYMKQTIGNACGTIGLLHALGNNQEALRFKQGSFLSDFFATGKAQTPDQRAGLLEKDTRLEEAHQTSAMQGSSAQTEETLNTDLHFVAFVERNGRLVELDGRRAGPMDRGQTSRDNLLQDAVRVIREEFMALNPDRLDFSAVALAPKAEW